MPSLRQKYTVSWDDGEPVEILSTVQDLINAVDRMPRASGRNQVALTTRTIHSALERSAEHEVPPYDEWIDLVDSYDEVTVVTGIEGPTPAGPSPIELSPSPASPESTGVAGSTETTPAP